jgi:hypothetical protein
LIAGHGGIKHHFPNGFPNGTKADAFENTSVFEREYGRRTQDPFSYQLHEWTIEKLTRQTSFICSLFAKKRDEDNFIPLSYLALVAA